MPNGVLAFNCHGNPITLENGVIHDAVAEVWARPIMIVANGVVLGHVQPTGDSGRAKVIRLSLTYDAISKVLAA